MDPLVAARQASHAAASSSQGNPQYTELSSSLPVYSTSSSGYPQAQQIQQDFEHILSRAHEHYRGGEYQKALQLCQTVAIPAFLLQESPIPATFEWIFQWERTR